ncbi:MAG TPA: hypothetical protein ENK32_06320 [Anaerolineae bacterium]|nr:hypothetical protein [Anaerolineae bacterium]
MDYGHIISRGWNITWNNKWLWVLGFLASLTSMRASSNFSTGNNTMFESLSPEQMMAASGVMLGLACLALVVFIIFALLSLAARGGLITAAAKLNRNEEITLGEAFSAGVAKIWSLAGMSLLLYLPIIIFVFVVAAVIGFMFAGAIGSAVAADGSGGDLGPGVIESMMAGFGLLFLCLALLACVFGIVGLLLRFINAFAFRGIMLHDMGVVESISHGWQIFKTNLGESLLLGILFFLISIGYGFLMSILLLPFIFIVFAPLWGSIISGDFSPLAMSYAFAGALCLGIVGAVLMSILTTWQSASFTLAYQYFTKKMA